MSWAKLLPLAALGAWTLVTPAAAQPCTTVNYTSKTFHSGCINASDLNANNADIYAAIAAINTSLAFPIPVASGGTGLIAGVSGGILGYTATGTLTPSALLGSGQIVLGGGAGATPTSIAILPVAKGGTNLASGTSGGILGYTAAGTLASSAVLGAGQIVIGGGAGATPTSITLVPVANGGTNLASGTSGGVLGYTGTGTLASSAALSAGQVVVGGGAGATPTTIANGQLPATATNDTAGAGKVGEIISSTVVIGSAVGLTTATNATVTSVSLTAGDWDCYGEVAFNPAGTTTIQVLRGWISTNGGVFPAPPSPNFSIGASFTTGTAQIFPTGTGTFSLASTTTIALGSTANFGVSTMSVYGSLICRRMR